jgi:DnaB-like helicase C terminal domain
LTFLEVSRVILAKLARDKGFVQEFKSWCPNVDQWVNSKEKQLADAFLRDCDSNSVEYAQWKFMQSADYQAIAEFITLDPKNTGVLKLEFANLLQQSRAEFIATEVLKTPTKAIELWRSYEAGLPFDDGLKDLRDSVAGAFKSYKEKTFNRELVNTIPNWPVLSDFIGGFNPGRLGLCLAQTGFGKTNLALNLALSARRKMNVWYFNMEMLIEDILERCWAIFYGTSFSELRKSCNINIDEFLNTFEFTKKLRVTSGRDKSLQEIKTLSRAQSLVEPAGLIIVDYDQKIQFDHNSKIPEWKALQLAMISLEDLAKELNCFVLVLAQSNPEGEISGSNRSRFSASSVWSFEDDEDLGPIIRFNKNRFGELNKVIRVNYERFCARVTENEIVAVAKKQKVKVKI